MTRGRFQADDAVRPEPALFHTIVPRIRGRRDTTLLVAAILVAVLLATTTETSEAICTPLTREHQESDELARAVIAYEAHMRQLPPHPEILTAPATNADGLIAGPFIAEGAGRDPSWWHRYVYNSRGPVFRRSGPVFRIGVSLGSESLEVIGRIERNHYCGAP